MKLPKPLNLCGLSLFFIFALSSVSIKASDDILQGYLELHQSLLSQKLEDIKLKASNLEKRVEQKKMKEELQEIAKSKTIRNARNEFKDVSSEFIDKFKDNLGKDHIIAYCPMAGAKWIQRKGKIENPYMDSDMRECGTKI